MAEQTLQLVLPDNLTETLVSYVVDFNGQQRHVAGMRHRMGLNALSGPVAHKIAAPGAEPRLRRELEVARYLGPRGGELLSKCLGYNFSEVPHSVVVTYRGRPLADLARDETNWPLDHMLRMKIITDLLQALELLRVSSIVHGRIGLDTLHWDGNTLQLTDFGQAALSGRYSDDRPAHHGDDIDAAGRVIYHVYTGQPPPGDPAELRRQIEQVQDVELRDLLLRRDLVTGMDVDYVFAEERDRRPTSRVLLDRLDEQPHGVQWHQVVAADRSVRQEFWSLRERQRDFRAAYASWVRRRPTSRPSRPSRPQRSWGTPTESGPPPRQPPGPPRRPAPKRPAASAGKLALLLLVGVAFVALAVITLLGVL